MATATPPSADEASHSIPARPGAVPDARRLAREAAERAGIGPDRVDDLALAVTEAVTNAIEAQLAAGDDRSITMRCLVEASELVVEVSDRAGGFDPSLLPPRPPRGHPDHLAVERGWGIQLMRELMDRVEFLPVAGGTAVRLVLERR